MRNYAVKGTTGEWQEFNGDELEQAIRELAGNPDLDAIHQFANRSQRAFEDDKSEVLSLLTTAISEQDDTFLTRLKEEVDTIKPFTRSDIARHFLPSGQVMSRDSLAMTQGLQVPPHIFVLSEVMGLQQPPKACGKLARVARKAGSHLARKQRQLRRTREIGTNVFIGHGRSLLWKDLKDFIQDRLSLPLGCPNRPLALDRFLDSKCQSRLSYAWWRSVFDEKGFIPARQLRPIRVLISI
jgi:hypothetical protein